jgi:hypothetical protein
MSRFFGVPIDGGQDAYDSGDMRNLMCLSLPKKLFVGKILDKPSTAITPEITPMDSIYSGPNNAAILPPVEKTRYLPLPAPLICSNPLLRAQDEPSLCSLAGLRSLQSSHGGIRRRQSPWRWRGYRIHRSCLSVSLARHEARHPRLALARLMYHIDHARRLPDDPIEHKVRSDRIAFAG